MNSQENLGLSGELRSIKGALPFAIAAQQRSLFLPKGNQQEVSYVDRSTVFVASHLTDIVAHLNKVSLLTPAPCKVGNESGLQSADMNEVQGQTAAKYALKLRPVGASRTDAWITGLWKKYVSTTHIDTCHR